jgi:hypothetical protein
MFLSAYTCVQSAETNEMQGRTQITARHGRISQELTGRLYVVSEAEQDVRSPGETSRTGRTEPRTDVTDRT